MIIDAYLCSDGTWRVPPVEIVDDASFQFWKNSFIGWKVIPGMWGLGLREKPPIYLTGT